MVKSQKEASTKYFKNWNLKETLSNPIARKFDKKSKTDEEAKQNKRKTDKILRKTWLDQYHVEYRIFYHFQKIESNIQHL